MKLSSKRIIFVQESFWIFSKVEKIIIVVWQTVKFYMLSYTSFITGDLQDAKVKRKPLQTFKSSQCSDCVVVACLLLHRCTLCIVKRIMGQKSKKWNEGVKYPVSLPLIFGSVITAQKRIETDIFIFVSVKFATIT